MKLDYELIKKILVKVEQESDGFKIIWIISSQMGDGFTQQQIDYHLDILKDDALIVVQATLKGVAGTTAVVRLTAKGHRVLDAMQNDKLWNKIKGVAIAAGIEGLKQIPALAISMLSGG